MKPWVKVAFKKIPTYIAKARSGYQLVRGVPHDIRHLVGKANWKEPGGKSLSHARARVPDFLSRTDREIRIHRGELTLTTEEQIHRLPITTDLDDPDVVEMLVEGARIDEALSPSQKALQMAIATREVQPPAVLTADDLVAMATYLKKPAARTLDSWKRELAQFLEFSGKSLPTSCTKEDALNYRQALLRRLSANTTKTKLAYLTGLWTVLTEEKPGTEHIFKGLVKRIKAEPAPKAYDIKEVDTWAGSIYIPVFKALYYTGARVGEIAGLRGEDIHKDRIVITPHPERSLKTKASDRVIPLHPSLAPVLEPHRGVSGLIWPALKGDGMRWGHNLGKPCKAVTGVNPHGLRHRAATRLREAGFNEAVIGKLLGHTPQTVTGGYGSIPWEKLVEAVESL